MIPMDDVNPAVQIHQESHQALPILAVAGVLDSSTYRTVRDAVIEAAIEEPPAVIVEIKGLHALSSSAWTVFTSARWHVSVWPDVPILLVCAEPQVRREISDVGVTRYVPILSTRKLRRHCHRRGRGQQFSPAEAARR